ncbi:MAG: hypothetical protein HW421_1570 [Ignavibacteria bacterium]|nr:hypothetical protein [Ignavibacteria bacterium]
MKYKKKKHSYIYEILKMAPIPEVPSGQENKEIDLQLNRIKVLAETGRDLKDENIVELLGYCLFKMWELQERIRILEENK